MVWCAVVWRAFQNDPFHSDMLNLLKSKGKPYSLFRMSESKIGHPSLGRSGVSRWFLNCCRTLSTSESLHYSMDHWSSPLAQFGVPEGAAPVHGVPGKKIHCLQQCTTKSDIVGKSYTIRR